MSDHARSLIRSILQDISLSLAERGELMYFKPRPTDSVSLQICPPAVPFYGSDIRCEDIDMSQSTLVTIASIGALSSKGSKIISIVDLLINSQISKRDYSILHVQSEYANTFSHPYLSMPNSLPHLLAELT